MSSAVSHYGLSRSSPLLSSAARARPRRKKSPVAGRPVGAAQTGGGALDEDSSPVTTNGAATPVAILAPRSGDAPSSSSTGVGSLRVSAAARPAWNERHHLLFNNEKASALDRCYFDRWREPEAVCGKHPQKIKSSLVWAMQKDDRSPADIVAQVLEDMNRRERPVGSWDSRHERLFFNAIHRNARSYFDRPREPEQMARPKCPGRKRSADARIVPNWKLNDGPNASANPDQHLLASLRRCSSAPYPSDEDKDTATTRRRRSQRPAWCDSANPLSP